LSTCTINVKSVYHKARLLKNVTNWNINFKGTGTMEKSSIKTELHHQRSYLIICGSGIFKEYSDQLWFLSIQWFWRRFSKTSNFSTNQKQQQTSLISGKVTTLFVQILGLWYLRRR